MVVLTADVFQLLIKLLIVYPVLFSLIFSCLCCHPAEDQLSSLPYTSFHRARDALLRMYADSRSVFYICTLNPSLNLSFCCICIPLAPSCKFTCRAPFLLSMLSMASSRGKRVPHSTTTTLLNSAAARGQHRCNTRLGGWTQFNIKEKQSFIMRVIVGDVPNSGYMLRFTQEHACLRINTKPVDMPEDSPETPQHPPKVTHRPERTWGILI